jgi:hypothetical protein
MIFLGLLLVSQRLYFRGKESSGQKNLASLKVVARKYTGIYVSEWTIYGDF